MFQPASIGLPELRNLSCQIIIFRSQEFIGRTYWLKLGVYFAQGADLFDGAHVGGLSGLGIEYNGLKWLSVMMNGSFRSQISKDNTGALYAPLHDPDVYSSK